MEVLMRKRIIRIAMLFALALAIITPSVVTALPSGPTYKEVVVATVKDTNNNDFVLRTNIYLPTTLQTAPSPLVLFIHGHGGAYNFSAGSRAYELSIALKDRGIAVATIDYRNAATGLLDVYDAKAYVRFFRAHAKEYNIDPNRIAIWGTSRGGHLAAMLETTGGMPQFEGNVGGNLDQSSAIQAAVIYYPLIDVFYGANEKSVFPEWFLGSQPSDNAAIVNAFLNHDTSSPMWKYIQFGQSLNPVNYVGPNDPPVLIAVSAIDPVVHMEPTWELFLKFVENKVDANAYIWSLGGHGQVGLDIEAATQEWMAKKLLVDLAPKK
jgi:acetyl esterase/lipase